MTTFRELAKYVRFQLSELLAQNKHHEFEHLARQFARLRICENLLPATGPVSAGGDQGRDFETYRTYLQSTPIATSTFLGSATGKKLVFACSLQQNIVPKIRADVTTICGGSEVIDGIFYFSTQAIPVAKRHQLQEWCQKTYHVELEIFDAEALSEQLTNLDVFWIAEEFLGVPSDLYPRIDSSDVMYEKYRLRWLTQEEPHNYADFSQIRYGLRQATFEDEAKPDLTKWLQKIETFLGKQYPRPLRRRAIYEICVASFRGLNNLTARKALVREYFADIGKLQDISEIDDASILLSYCSSAFLQGHLEIDVETLVKWTKSLVTILDTAIRKTSASGSLCRLFLIRGQAGYLPFREGATPKYSLDETFEWWFRLLKEVNNAPLFPLENFADLLTKLTSFLGDHEEFLKLTQETDELLTIRSSGRVAAEKCRDRAMAYYHSEKYLLAIQQLHQAKIKWFSAETLRGSLLSMLLLSHCYGKLGLVYPAKYYAACVAFLALHHDDEEIKPLISKALFIYSETCHQGGEWLTFAQISKCALASHNAYDDKPLDIEKHESLSRLFIHTAIIRTVAQRFDVDLAAAFDTVFAEWPIDSGTRTGIQELSADGGGYWQSVSTEKLWETAQAQLSGRPFSDVGEKRLVRWKALGIAWTVEFDNEYDTWRISEEFVSTIQIILTDLATRDLLLLPTNVLVKTHIIEGTEIDVKEEPSNNVATWRVGFPRSWDSKADKDFRASIFSVAVTVLWKCSLLKWEKFQAKLKRAFSDGLPSKTFAVRPYADLCAEFITKDDFHLPNRRVFKPLLSASPFECSEHTQLGWIQNDGPGYSKERAAKFLKNRYRQGMQPIKFTLRHLLLNEKCRNLIKTLQKDKYLDWEILILIGNICVDYRVKQRLSPSAPPDAQARLMNELMFCDETEADPKIPFSLFTEGRVEIQKIISLAAIAGTWGLEIHQHTPDFAALERLLDARYHSSEDDIPHQDPFRRD